MPSADGEDEFDDFERSVEEGGVGVVGSEDVKSEGEI